MAIYWLTGKRQIKALCLVQLRVIVTTYKGGCHKNIKADANTLQEILTEICDTILIVRAEVTW